MTIYTANAREAAHNCLYPNRCVITDADALRTAAGSDYVCAEYAGNYRSLRNFLRSDCLAFDVDNDFSDEAAAWVTPETLRSRFPDAAFFVHYSRHHQREKAGRAARPKFHVLFPIPEVTSAEDYTALKRAVQAAFPYFDPQALDAARFFFGTEPAEAEAYPGSGCILDYVDVDSDPGSGALVPASAATVAGCSSLCRPLSAAEEDFPGTASAAPSGDASSGDASSSLVCVIPEGERNYTLHRFATRVLKRYGLSDRALELYRQETQKCSPPLPPREVEAIWQSAVRFFHRVVETAPDYIPPEEYRQDPFGPNSLKPPDYSDIGEARILVQEAGSELCYSDFTDFLCYDGTRWVESHQRAAGAMIELLDLQLANAGDQLLFAIEKLKESGIPESTIAAGIKAIEKALETEEQEKAFRIYRAADTYLAFVHRRRDMRYVFSALQAAKPMLEIDIAALDADAFLFNTPAGTYDLCDGMSSCREHDPLQHITKITSCSPGEDGRAIWEEALNTFFCGDEELIEYVQQIVGLAAIGKVYVEAMIIAYGEGRNGKSTFWNTIARVLGSYSGQLSADALTIGCKRNVKPEMAELRGKRLVIAAELEDGMRLSTSMMKQLCSTDTIYAEPKYKAPFSFVSTHTLVLYTNHLPRVSASDPGTWRRLIVIPFNAVIEGNSDIKNYTDYLVENCGPYVLQWIIEGAQKVIWNHYHLSCPACVADAIADYRNSCNWLQDFLDECCNVSSELSQPSGALYTEYLAYCARTNEHKHSTKEFYAALERAGFHREKLRFGNVITGLALRSELF